MEALILQDWISLSGNSTSPGSDVIQTSSHWLDLADAREAVLFLECSWKSGTPHLWFETAPTRDSNQFTKMKDISLAASTTAVVSSFLVYDAPAVPLMRWLRWRLKVDIGAGAWEAVFRVTVMSYGR